MRFRRSLILAIAALIGGAALPAATSPAKATWVRVQFDGRITESGRAALQHAGLRSLQYAPVDAYVAYATPLAANAAADVATVTSVRPLAAADKISSELAGATGRVPVAVISAGGGETAQALAATGTVRGSFDLRGDGALQVVEAVV
ncbi:MAG TPA: hypothetical protein VG602_00065, partial [Actinomycetota bacterium]|nr:hypothetical protein [Actinomycetota bacterium]